MPKTFGIPQNRERVFTISIRKDIDDYSFEFPEPIELKLRLKDLMDEVVEEKYYLSDAQLKHIIENGNMNCHPSGKGQNGKVYVGNIAPTLTTGKGEGPKVLATEGDTLQCIQVGQMYGTEVEPNPQAGRIYDSRGISPTLDTCSGGNRMPKVVEEPKIITHKIQQNVKVRVYPVDTEKLKITLRDAKNKYNITNKYIAEQLNLAITQVEHYFRIDGSFAIPSPEIWCKLKEILKIETDEFDRSILTFEEKENTYDKSNRVYDEKGIAPTLQCSDDVGVVVHTEKNQFDVSEPQVLKYERTEFGKQVRKEYESGNIYLHRNDMRELVPRTDGISNTLTTVLKDNYDVELFRSRDIETIKNAINENAKHQQDLVQTEQDICRTIPAGTHGSTPHLLKTNVTTDTVNKDSFIVSKYKDFYDKYGYVPDMFNPYNSTEINDVAPTITTVCGSTTSSSSILVKSDTNVIANDIAKVVRVGGLYDKEDKIHQAGSIYDENGICDTLDSMQGGNRQPIVLKNNIPNIRIRKLTPKECWRLQGFDDEDYGKAEKVNSNTQLYKQAGNSICVNVLEKIFINLLQLDEDRFNLKAKYGTKKKTLFSFDI